MKPIHTFLGVRIHWGEPHYRSSLRAYTGSIKSKKQDQWINIFTDHEIVRWYGLSIKLVGFIGLQIFGHTTHPREPGPLPFAEDWGQR